MGEWLSLLDYSAKFGVSLSTLRRRIKSESIIFKQDGGKYFIQVDASAEPKISRPVPLPFSSVSPSSSSQKVSSVENPKIYSKETLALNQTVPSFVEASVLTSANRLVEELKNAYAKILQEKEVLISHLKEEISDLRMLVKIMEQQAAPQPQTKSSEDIFFGDINLKDL